MITWRSDRHRNILRLHTARILASVYICFLLYSSFFFPLYFSPRFLIFFLLVSIISLLSLPSSSAWHYASTITRICAGRIVKVMLRPTVSRPVCLGVTPPIRAPTPDLYYCQTVAGLTWGALSDERTGLSFTIAAGPRQRSHSRVWVLLDSWPHFIVSDSRLPQPGGPGPRIYIPQEQGGPVIPPGTGLSFRRLLRLAGLRWRYSNPPPQFCKREIHFQYDQSNEPSVANRVHGRKSYRRSRTSSLVIRCVLSILWVVTMFSCGYSQYTIQKRRFVRLTRGRWR
jgi:hypothetical protein